MDIMVLDSNLSAYGVIDSYESVIWTERYQEYGDFEIHTAASMENIEKLKRGSYVICKDSYDTMIIEYVLIETDSEEGNKLTVSGRSLVSILKRRIVWEQTTLNSSLVTAVERLLNENVIKPKDPNRRIDRVIFKKPTDPRITKLKVNAQYTGDNLYDVIKDICEVHELGFRMVLTPDDKFQFELYYGEDRSYEQDDNPYVEFSPSFDNLIDSNYLENSIGWKNSALIAGQGEGLNRRTVHIGSNLKGLNRRELYIDARDLAVNDAEELNLLKDITSWTKGYLKDDVGSISTDDKYGERTTPFIDIGGIDKLRIELHYSETPAYQWVGYILYDKNKKNIGARSNNHLKGTQKQWGYWEKLVDTPSNAKFIRLSARGLAEEQVDLRLFEDDYDQILLNRGDERMQEHKFIEVFEGEAESLRMYIYGEDFFMGDLVQVRNEYDIQGRSRVTELIRSNNINTGYTVVPAFRSIDKDDD